MTISLILLGLFVAVTFALWREGLWSTAIMFLNILAAATFATAWYETLVAFLLKRGLSSYDYLLDFLHRLQELNPTAYQRIAYIEQPTVRDLAANRHQVIRAASALLPVVIDESLVDLTSLQLARELGYTGVALKACKGQSQSVIFATAARKLGMSLCVQDLTCPADSLIHSAGLAAHVRGVAAIEANSRQYCPGANRGWDERFPGIFTIRNGRMPTAQLNGLGLGAW